MILTVRKIALFLVPVVALLSACSPVVHRQLTTTFDDVESFINDHPDSVLTVLSGVDSAALNTRALRARYSLLYVMALDKCYEDITVPGLLDPAVAWYERHGSADEKMKTLYYEGRIAQANKNSSDAAVCYSRAEAFSERVQDKHALGLLYLAESALYEGKFNVEKEREYVEKALHVFQEAKDPIYESVQGDLAHVYQEKGEWHRADSLYEVAIAHSDAYPHALNLYLSNFARMKVQQPEMDPEGTIALLNRKQSLSGGLTYKEAGAYAYALALTGQIAASESLRLRLDSLKGRERFDVLPWLRRMAVYRGDYQLAYSYQAEALAEEEAVVVESLEDSVAQALREYYEQSAQRERERRLRWGLYALSAVIALLLLAMLLLLRERRIRAERDRLLSIRAELEQELLSQETLVATLSEDASRLEQLRFQLRQERLERFRKRGRFGYMVWMEENGRSSNADVVRMLRKDMHEVCAMEKDTRALERRLNSELNDIVAHLKEDLDIQKNSKEERFLCYWLIDLRADMIAELLSLSIDNVYVKSHRLEGRIRALDKAEYALLLKKKLTNPVESQV